MAENAIARQQTDLAPAPEYLDRKDKRGLEGTTQSDMLIPRLALAQPLSPQVIEGHQQQIPGLKVGDLFNSVTGKVYGKKVVVQLIRRMPLRAIEFYPIDDGGGIKDMNVPLNDERCKWHDDEEPVATVFRDFFAVILPERELISLSFKRSGMRPAKMLWTLVMGRGRAVWAGTYAITTGMKQDPKPHQIYVVDNEGWASEQDAKLAEQQYDVIKDWQFEDVQIDRGTATDVAAEPMKTGAPQSDM